MSELLKICQMRNLSNVSDIHLAVGQPVFYRLHGIIHKFEKKIVTEEIIKKIIHETSTPRVREIFSSQKQVTYAENIESLGRLRFSLFVDKGKLAIAIRFIRENIRTLNDIGLTKGSQTVLSQQSGLILVGSPSGEGRTSTIASMLNHINQLFEKNIFTIENPVEYVFKDNKSAFIQRSIPVDISNFYTGLCEAYRLNPDIVVTDSINYADTMDQAFTLCESGCLVIASTDGGDCQQIIERLINSREASLRDSLRIKLASQLKMVVSQRLISQGEDRSVIVDIIINTVLVKNLIRSNSLTMLRSLQEQSGAIGMKTFDAQLISMLSKKIISMKTALSLAIDKRRVSGL